MNKLTKHSKRLSKTLVELSIGIIGVLAIMISQLGAQPDQVVKLEGLTNTTPVKLVFMLPQGIEVKDIAVTAIAVKSKLNRKY